MNLFSVSVLWIFFVYCKRLSLHVEIPNVFFFDIFLFVEFFVNGNKSNLQNKKINVKILKIQLSCYSIQNENNNKKTKKKHHETHNL